MGFERKPNVRDNAPMSKVEDLMSCKAKLEEDMDEVRKIDDGGICKWIELEID